MSLSNDPTDPAAARTQQVEAVFPEAYETLSTAIRELAELRSEVSRLRASTYLLMLSGGDVKPDLKRPTTMGDAPDAWVREPRYVGGRDGEDPQLDDDSFDWAAWIQRLPPVKASSAGPGTPGISFASSREHN